MSDTTLRVRGLLDRHFHLFAIALVVFVVVSGAVAYGAHVDPPTEPQEQVVSTWGTSGGFTHSATVTTENSVFQPGTVLEDRPAYFTRITPILDGTFTFEYDAATAEDVTVDLAVTQVLRAVDGETVYWSEETALGSVAADDVAPGEPVEAAFDVNVTAIDDRLITIQSDLGGSVGETEVFVLVEAELAGTVDGEPTEHRTAAQLPLELSGPVYTVDDPGTERATIERTETVTVVQEAGPLQWIGAPLLLVVALLGLVGLGLTRHRGHLALTDVEREYLQYRDDRQEFEEWITRIHLPKESFDRPEARAATLGDLVDFAIDSETGVVEEPYTGEFYVVTEDCVFTYSAPSLDGKSLQ